MAATINTRSVSSGDGFEPCTDESKKPILINKIDGLPDKINFAILLSREDGVITLCEDRSVRVWLKRDSGQYWPSICHFLPSVPLCASFSEQTSRLFIGLSTGVITEFTIAEDYNSIAHVKDFVAHSNGVTSVLHSIECEWLLSTGRDKTMVWQCSETARKLGSYSMESWPTCMEFDGAAKYVFVGDYSGSILVLRIQDNVCSLVSKLSAHTGSIRSLGWDAQRQLLFSGSFDQLIIVWDIGGKKGNAYELTGHRSKVTSLAYASGKNTLLSASDNGDLVCWDMSVDRIETPEWKTNDTCQRCDAPFFWNFRAMWAKKVVGLRQHHCRLCGQAVCDPCSNHTTKYPKMGYELEVRICDGCYRTLQEDTHVDLQPHAILHQTKHSVLLIQLNEMINRMITVGSDRVVKIWDVKQMLR